METVHAQNIGIPVLGFGTFRLRGEECRRAVEAALEIGYRHIDTAEIYGNESVVGEVLRASPVRRETLFVTTKAWKDDLSPEGVRRSLQGSLDRLGLEYVDLWLIHWPNPAYDLRVTLDAMMDLKDQGRTRAIGVSNFPVAMFEEASVLAPVACNQVEYHPYLAQDAVLRAARAHHAAVTAYSPLAIGKVLNDSVLVAIGRKHGKSAAQVALRWLIQQPGVVAIPKAGDRKHAEENFDVFDFALDDEDMKSVGDLSRGVRLTNPAHAPRWEASR